MVNSSLNSFSSRMSESTAAINHLPDEILLRILQLAIRSTFRIHPARQLSAFSSVNRHWRLICSNSSELWTDIRIIYNELSGKVFLGDWTRRCLERSHPRPVNIYLDIPDIEKLFAHPCVRAIRSERNVISVLMKHLDRIRSLTTTNDESTAKSSGLPALINSLPKATHLKHLDFRSLNLTNPPSFFISIVSPLERLSSVDCHLLLPNEDSFRQMARMCPTLERLTLRSLEPLEIPLPSGAPPIPMPSLRFLSVKFNPPTWWYSPRKSILSILSAPKLHYLRIVGSPGSPHPRNVLPPLTFFPFLHTLRLDDFGFVDPISRTTLIDPTYFREASSVEHLHLVNTSAEALFPVPRSRNSVKRSKNSFDTVQEITLPLSTPGRDERDTTNTSTNDLIRDLSTTTVIPSPFSFNFLPTDSIPLPSLKTLTLDSTCPQDVMWLCELVANRQSHVPPSSSSSIKRVYLSRLSMKHLRGFTNSGTGLVFVSTAVVNSEASPATVVVRYEGRSFEDPGFLGKSKGEEKKGKGKEDKEKRKKDDGFTLERWLRDRVDVCEWNMENEEDEEDI
ncbi:hypothetical protein K435DRAFT_969802 [Dendrothele bispora CBS 962.96]|uniref:F-box domain-containing protein n=1 Tax=Dendrothele bispora (strain CBS 962.96) TaxID=1314807 RepID=A0A4S8LF89_DENBC|nr:hypothetical protein K435DRAFT_969802 [Dendrothele bispora CBS 962.96]